MSMEVIGSTGLIPFTLKRSKSPVHHFCPKKPVSKYELLRIFESVFQKRVEIIPSCAGDMPVRRVLATHYHSLKHLFDQDLDRPLQ